MILAFKSQLSMVVFSEIPISAMPKLPVAKYCYHGILDYEIGITRYGLVVFAVPYPGITKQLPEEELEFCAFAFVGRHIPVPLLFCQAIHSFFCTPDMQHTVRNIKVLILI